MPILGGGRLTGKVGDFSVGAINIQTDDSQATGAIATNFTVLRVKRDILRRSRVGAIFTNRSVSLEDDGANQAYGFDGAFSFYDNVNIYGYYARTNTPGLEDDAESYRRRFPMKATATASSSTICSSAGTSSPRWASCAGRTFGAPTCTGSSARGRGVSRRFASSPGGRASTTS